MELPHIYGQQLVVASSGGLLLEVRGSERRPANVKTILVVLKPRAYRICLMILKTYSQSCLSVSHAQQLMATSSSGRLMLEGVGWGRR